MKTPSPARFGLTADKNWESSILADVRGYAISTVDVKFSSRFCKRFDQNEPRP